MHYYRIGDFARRMSVSTHLLKHYEDEGVIHPDVRPNGYRFYNLHDSALLMECRALRNLDFSVRETRELLYGPDGASLAEALRRREDGLRTELARKQLLLDELTRQCALVSRISAGEAEILETEPAWYLPHVEQGTFQTDSSIYEILGTWQSWMPVTCSCLLISPESLDAEQPPQEARRIGMVVTDTAAKRCGIPTGAPAEYLAPRRVMRFYLAAAAGRDRPKILAAEFGCLQRVRAAGETPEGWLRKTVLFYNDEGGERTQYSLLDVPLAAKNP